MNYKSIKFSRTNQAEFISDLRKRVKGYFDSNEISVHGNGTMFAKTAAMFIMYFGPYALMLAGVVTQPWLVLLSSRDQVQM